MSESKFVLVPGGIPLDRRAMLDALAALPKPVQCVGFEFAGMLGVGWWPLDGHSTALRFNESDVAELFGAPVGSRSGTKDLKVLVEVETASKSFEYAALLVWAREYVLPFVSVGFDDRLAHLTDEDAVGVVTFTMPSGDEPSFGSTTEP